MSVSAGEGSVPCVVRAPSALTAASRPASTPSNIAPRVSPTGPTRAGTSRRGARPATPSSPAAPASAGPADIRGAPSAAVTCACPSINPTEWVSIMSQTPRFALFMKMSDAVPPTMARIAVSVRRGERTTLRTATPASDGMRSRYPAAADVNIARRTGTVAEAKNERAGATAVYAGPR